MPRIFVHLVAPAGISVCLIALALPAAVYAQSDVAKVYKTNCSPKSSAKAKGKCLLSERSSRRTTSNNSFPTSEHCRRRSDRQQVPLLWNQEPGASAGFTNLRIGRIRCVKAREIQEAVRTNLWCLHPLLKIDALFSAHCSESARFLWVACCLCRSFGSFCTLFSDRLHQ